MAQAYYTLDQAIEMLQISESSIRRAIKKGTIPHATFVGRILIPAYFFKQAMEGPTK